jgi:RNA polymerase sigma-70 factor (ECF subfamily)
MDERQLLKLLKGGDNGAFDAIFRKYASELYRFSLSRGCTAQQAEEIVQETFMKIWELRWQVEPDRNFASWLMTIAKHKIYNMFRRRVVELKWDVEAMTPSDTTTVEDGLQLEYLRRLLFDGIERLVPRQREILMLKSNGMSNEEIASRLSIPKKMVENNIYKAYRQLRIDLGGIKDALLAVVAAVIGLINY